MLTVTDSNTTGLRGPVLTLDEIQARGNVLRADENWAAFEGMGYTKEDDAAWVRGDKVKPPSCTTPSCRDPLLLSKTG